MTKQNQQQKNLNEFRADIDKIDQKILNLLQERMQIVRNVAEFKKENNENFFIKSAREANMIKDLIKQSQDFLPCAISKIWRAIITSANMLEQPINALIFNPKKISDYQYLIKNYYLDILPITEFENIDNLFAQIDKNKAQIAVFPALDFTQNWWLDLANNKPDLKIFAKIPFLKDENSNHQLFLSAIKQPEESSSDNSLLVIEINKNFNENHLINAFENCAISAKILSNFSKETNVYLVETQGFFDLKNEKLINFCQEKISPIVKIIGHYPV
jgi:chorismate mutase/prephenate dehydratase